jgi:para-nitrobenzyl esterase
MKKKLFILLMAAALSAPGAMYAQVSVPPPIQAGSNIGVVKTESGAVRGYIHKGIFTYKNITYAYADRFMPPAKPEAWQGVRTTLAYGPVCPIDATTSVNDSGEFPFQHELGYSNEHCQNLNVWTPKINDGKKRPVMVWFHGGGYTNGSAIEQPGYDGENLARKGDVVVVSVNHRLNVLGFLDLSAYGDKYKASANAGLMDLVASLQWIKQNIAQFGGDPANVTIFGQSGGGGKVSCMMNAPSAKGLFSKAIVESGSSATNYTDKTVSQRIAAALLEELKLQPSQIDSLQKIPYDRLNAASKVAIRKASAALRAEGKRGGGGWGPIFDGYFFPYQPTDQQTKDLSKNIPLMVGTTKNEFTPFTPDAAGLNMDMVKATLKKEYGDQADAYMAAVQKAYPGTTKPTNFLDIDVRFRPGALRQANMRAVPGAAPVYMYVFAWQSPVNDGVYKAMHCSEIPFVFNNISRCEEMTGGGKDAYALSAKMSSAWLNFARTGNPNAPGLPQWPAYTEAVGATMIFDNQSTLRNHHDADLQKIAASKQQGL